MDDAKELYDKMCSMSEYEIIREMASFRESNILLKLNYQELSALFENFRQTVMKDFSKEIPYNNVNTEIKRLIHNYLCSAISLIDHTRVYIKKLHSDECNLQEYQCKMKSTFVESYVCAFVKDLRQYIQHYRIPEISFQKKLLTIKPHASLIISKDELLKFSGWTNKSKQFISRNIGDIDLRSVFIEYQLIVEEFYDWLLNWQESIFGMKSGQLMNLRAPLKKLD